MLIKFFWSSGNARKLSTKFIGWELCIVQVLIKIVKMTVFQVLGYYFTINVNTICLTQGAPLVVLNGQKEKSWATCNYYFFHRLTFKFWWKPYKSFWRYSVYANKTFLPPFNLFSRYNFIRFSILINQNIFTELRSESLFLSLN